MTHHDLQLEALAAAEQVDTVEDAPDADLAVSALGAGALELTQTLSGLYPAGIIAASVTGPATMAERLAAQLGETDIALDTAALDCGDALAALAAGMSSGREPHDRPGAERRLPRAPGAGAGARTAATPPCPTRRGRGGGRRAGPARLRLRRRGLHHRWARSGPTSGRDAFADSASLELALAAAEQSAGADAVLISDGPVPGDCDLTALRWLGERAAERNRPGGAR